jgi:CHAT domain-containing protein/tetratricopeptide (TPR) repeat protein
MFNTNYHIVTERLRSTRRQPLILKCDQNIIQELLNTLGPNLRIQHESLVDLVERDRQSIELYGEFIRNQSEENFNEAFEASRSSINSYRSLRAKFSKSAGFINNYGCSSATHEFFNPGKQDYSKSIELFRHVIYIEFLYHRAWYNLSLIYETKGNLMFSYPLKFISYLVEALNLLLPHMFRASRTIVNHVTDNANNIQQQSHSLYTVARSRASRYINIIIQSSNNNFWSSGNENSVRLRDLEITNELEVVGQLQQINQLLASRNSYSVYTHLERLITGCQDDFDMCPREYYTIDNLYIDLEILENALRHQTTGNLEERNPTMAARAILNWLLQHAVLDFSLPTFSPSHSVDWENLGQVLIRENFFLEGILSIAQAINLSANRVSAQSYYSLGIAHFNRGYYEDAITCFDRAITLRPNWHDPLQYKGHAHNEISDYSTAILVFTKYLNFNQNHLNSRLGIATAQYYSHDYHSAVITFQELINIKSTEPKFYLGMIKSLHGCNELVETIEWLEKLIELNKAYWYFYIYRMTSGWKFAPTSTLHSAQINRYAQNSLHFNAGRVHCTDFYYLVGQISWHTGCSIKKIAEQKKWFRLAKENLLNGFEILNSQILEEGILNEKKLEFIELLIPLYRALAEVSSSPSDANIVTQESIALQREGENILARLLENLPSKGNQFRLFMKFSNFSALRIDQLAQSHDLEHQRQALVFAEIHKKLCLEHMKHDYCSQTTTSDSVNYQRIENIVQNGNTAIIYWHISPASVTTFIIRQDNLIVYRHSPWTHQGLPYWLNLINKIFFLPRPRRLRTFYFPKNIQQLSALESWLRNWKKDYINYQASSLQEKEHHAWRSRMDSNLQNLSSTLGIQKVQNYLKGENNLILIPHRGLHLIPMHLLFKDDLTIRYLPSIFFREHSNSGAHYNQPSQNGIVFIGGYSNNLNYGFLERAKIEELFLRRSTIFEQGEVDFELFSSLSTNIRRRNLAVSTTMLHFSGHAKHDHCNPLKSALELEENVIFTVKNILQNSNEFRDFDLICLSACETGITSSTEIVKEYIGLSSAFLSSGCSTIISSLWKVPEHVTALLFMKFYQLLIDHENSPNGAPVALKQAQKWIRELDYNELSSFIDSNELIFNQSNCNSVRRTLRREFSKSRDDSAPFSIQVRLNTFAAFTDLLFPDSPNCPYAHPYYWAGFTVNSIDV